MSVERIPVKVFHGRAYEEAIAAAGGIDVQILGIGRIGHMGFNFLDMPFHSTGVVQKTPLTAFA